MAAPRSAGLLLFRRQLPDRLAVLLAHPGGPFWRRRDDGAWTLPKGEITVGEETLAAAIREFQEETGFACEPPYLPLGEARQKSGKRITAWACEGDADPANLVSNEFDVEWPPKSGQLRAFPEVDRVAWYSVEEARIKLLEGQRPFLDALQRVMRAA